MFALMLAVVIAAEPSEAPLWGDKIPGPTSKDATNVPTLTTRLAEKPNGTAVIVCPGGGYSGRATDHEGKQIAEWLNARGVHAFILKYRTVNESQITAPLHPGPMLDVQRAIRTVRSKAGQAGIDANRIGVWGFSAGGHLASTAATHFDSGKADADDPIDKVSCRPDFAILAYPVISMKDGVVHRGSRTNLIGNAPDPKLIDFYSNELQVTKDTPPTFLFHTDQDSGVLPENSVLFYLALKKNKVPAELHIFEKGPHGVGLGTDPRWAKGAPGVSAWPDRLEAWMRGRGLLGTTVGQSISPARRLGVGHSLLADTEKAKPANGFIATSGELTKLYEAWRLRMPMPEVDFSKEFVVVVTSTEKPIYDVALEVDEKAGAAVVKPDLRGEHKHKGFLFWVGTFPRAGLKSINGKPLEGK